MECSGMFWSGTALEVGLGEGLARLLLEVLLLLRMLLRHLLCLHPKSQRSVPFKSQGLVPASSTFARDKLQQATASVEVLSTPPPPSPVHSHPIPRSFQRNSKSQGLVSQQSRFSIASAAAGAAPPPPSSEFPKVNVQYHPKVKVYYPQSEGLVFLKSKFSTLREALLLVLMLLRNLLRLNFEAFPNVKVYYSKSEYLVFQKSGFSTSTVISGAGASSASAPPPLSPACRKSTFIQKSTSSTIQKSRFGTSTVNICPG